MNAPLGLDSQLTIGTNAMSPSVMKRAPAVLVLVGALGLGGCATKGFVREQVATVSQRVDALDAKLQETDGTAKSALSQAQAAAAQAQAATGQAQNNGQRLDQLSARVDGIEQRMQESRRKRARH
jgi:outer membrane murein-binding lipoprotein Lpp